MNWLECLNETFKTYAPTLDAADKLIGIAISAGLPRKRNCQEQS